MATSPRPEVSAVPPGAAVAADHPRPDLRPLPPVPGPVALHEPLGPAQHRPRRRQQLRAVLRRRALADRRDGVSAIGLPDRRAAARMPDGRRAARASHGAGAAARRIAAARAGDRRGRRGRDDRARDEAPSGVRLRAGGLRRRRSALAGAVHPRRAGARRRERSRAHHAGEASARGADRLHQSRAGGHPRRRQAARTVQGAT